MRSRTAGVRHEVLKRNKEGCSEQSKLQPPPQTWILACELIDELNFLAGRSAEKLKRLLLTKRQISMFCVTEIAVAGRPTNQKALQGISKRNHDPEAMHLMMLSVAPAAL